MALAVATALIASIALVIVTTQRSDLPTMPTIDALATQPGQSSHARFVPGRAFVAADTVTVRTDSGGGCIDVGDDDQVHLGLDLPHGAVVTGVTFHTYDTDAEDTTLEVQRHDTATATGGAAPVTDVVWRLSTTTEDAGFATVRATSPLVADGAAIDLDTWTYSLVVLGGGEPHDVCGVRLEYTVDDGSALTFHQVGPCVAFDTRPGRGGRETPLAGGATATFDLVAVDHGPEGGARGGCRLPPATGADRDGTVAVLVNLVALDAGDFGNLKLWDADVPEPDGGVVVFPAGGQNANAVTVGVSDGGDLDDGGLVVVRNNSRGATHVRGVVLGYYTRAPRAMP